MKQKTFNIINLGCAKNTVDSEIIKGNLQHHNFIYSDDIEKAETLIINTCGFLDSAREESVDAILEVVELKKQNASKKIVVAGCMSERFKDELSAEIPEVDSYFGANAMQDVIKYLTGKQFLAYDPTLWRNLITPSHYAYFKIAEGCDNTCSFCAIPMMRGKQQSKTIDTLVKEANVLVERGVKELIVIAQDLTSYGWDLQPKTDLTNLLTELDDVEGLEWIRLHYLHPSHFGPKLLPFLEKAKRIIPYLDMPTQHINSRLLKDMKRGLNGNGIQKLLTTIRQRIPNIIIRNSLIVGYPGETEEEFEELHDFIKEFRFDRLGVFTYSEETGTEAAELENDIPEYVKEARMVKIMQTQQQISLENNQKLIDTKQKVLIDSYNVSDNISYGRTFRDSPEIDNQVIVNGKLTPGEFYDLEINDALEYDLFAEVE